MRFRFPAWILAGTLALSLGCTSDVDIEPPEGVDDEVPELDIGVGVPSGNGEGEGEGEGETEGDDG